ncbi:hypothetical protein POTOM_054628 [Populus tomentosa]|uniref:SANTA domain-containing protein n=1 Tax=Populus tomentosa TaxID=118781 RepID=A0A8X8C3C9_POPTO|nr:hypothetical protein POTOM_054628 [Populus tomentosa]
MSSEAKKRKGFSSSTTPAPLTKILIRSLSRLNSRTPSNTVPLSSVSLNSVRTVWLHDWWLVKVEGNGLAVSGFTSREGVGTRLFCSAAIVKRHYTTILEARDGITVTLSGFINRDRAHENGFSFQVCYHLCSDSCSDSVIEMIRCCVLFDFRNFKCCSHLLV